MQHLVKKIFLIIILFFVAFLPHNAFAAESIKSKYFNIHIYDGIDKVQLLKKLDAEYFLRRSVAYFEETGRPTADFDTLLGDTLDAVYLQVSDIIDIHMYSLTVGLDILPDKRALADTLEAYLNNRIDVPSFYFHDKNTIYISFADLNAGMLAHEITHAIVTHYFAVPPPTKLQEILSGYSEYSIRKLIGKSHDSD